jgi:hypothetical protein
MPITIDGTNGTAGNSFRIAYYTQSQSLSAPSVTPNPTTGSTSFPTSVAWAGTITTPAAGQSLWAIDGTYVPSSNQTTWSAPYLTQGFPTTIQSDNYVLNTSGWQIQRNTGDAFFNNGNFRGNINGGANINITGTGYFGGSTSGTGPGGATTYAIVANSGFAANGGIIGYSSMIFNGAIMGYGSGNAFGVYGNQTGSQSAVQAANTVGGIGIYNAVGTMATNNSTQVTNLNANYLQGNLASAFATVASGNDAYAANRLNGSAGLNVMRFVKGTITGASTATFVSSNKPGTSTTSNVWLEVTIDSTTVFIPVWT